MHFGKMAKLMFFVTLFAFPLVFGLGNYADPTMSFHVVYRGVLAAELVCLPIFTLMGMVADGDKNYKPPVPITAILKTTQIDYSEKSKLVSVVQVVVEIDGVPQLMRIPLTTMVSVLNQHPELRAFVVTTAEEWLTRHGYRGSNRRRGVITRSQPASSSEGN